MGAMGDDKMSMIMDGVGASTSLTVVGLVLATGGVATALFVGTAEKGLAGVCCCCCCCCCGGGCWYS